MPSLEMGKPLDGAAASNGLLTNYVSTMETREPGQSQTLSESFAGCSERPSSKAQGRSVLSAVRWASERRENAAGGLCQQSAKRPICRAACHKTGDCLPL